MAMQGMEFSIPVGETDDDSSKRMAVKFRRAVG